MVFTRTNWGFAIALLVYRRVVFWKGSKSQSLGPDSRPCGSEQRMGQCHCQRQILRSQLLGCVRGTQLDWGWLGVTRLGNASVCNLFSCQNCRSLRLEPTFEQRVLWRHVPERLQKTVWDSLPREPDLITWACVNWFVCVCVCLYLILFLRVYLKNVYLGGGFKHFLFSPLFGEMIPID